MGQCHHLPLCHRSIRAEANQMTIDRIGQCGRRNRRLFTPHQSYKIGHEAQITAAMTAKGAGHIAADAEIDGFFRVLVTRARVKMTDDKATILQIALNFTGCTD